MLAVEPWEDDCEPLEPGKFGSCTPFTEALVSKPPLLPLLDAVEPLLCEGDPGEEPDDELEEELDGDELDEELERDPELDTEGLERELLLELLGIEGCDELLELELDVVWQPASRAARQQPRTTPRRGAPCPAAKRGLLKLAPCRCSLLSCLALLMCGFPPETRARALGSALPR